MSSNTDEKTNAALALCDFAWKVAGPREFLINFFLNAGIAWICYRKAEHLTIADNAPILAYLGPMFFLLPLLTTFFGYMNGILARQRGIGPPWPAKFEWKKTALRTGFVRGALLCPVCILFCLGFQQFLFAGQFSLLTGVMLIGVIAGVAGYVLHASAIQRSARLGFDSARDGNEKSK
jgi:hypothetical protein